MRPTARLCLPIHFGSAAEPLFGWFHAPRAPARGAGIVVCHPIGDDYVRAHRALRHLAERLQRAGFAVLRFDFGGTGDSAGDERGVERVRGWIGDVGRAVDELRARAGVDEVCVIGARLGATLAAVAAAERGDVAALALWSAYLDGRAYVDETTRLYKMHKLLEPRSFAAEPRDWQPGGAEALGFLLTPATVAALGGVDLRALPRPAPRVLVVGAGAASPQAALAERLSLVGAETTYERVPSDRFLIMVPHEASLPTAALEAIVGWVAARWPLRSARPLRKPAPATMRATNEAPLSFGDGGRLFGILTRAETPADERPAIVLLSAGTVHRIGPHRLYVMLARRWARLGFAVMRMDLSGIGDSLATAGASENLCYPDGAIAEVRTAMSALERGGVARRFILGGLCSGGDLTFQTALADARVVGALIMNPRTFCVHDLALVEREQRARDHLSSLRGRRPLRQILERETLGALLTNVRRLMRARSTRMIDDVPARLRELADRGVDTLLVKSDHDPGVEFVDRHFARQMRALDGLPRFRRVDLAGTDHTFTSLFAQELLATALGDHLARGWR
ncbi:MAG TPA: alpha/beta hydrolase [Polyangia bacterium]|jgi:alpha-beta hydrolase superfamily lysophospholipase